MGAAPLPPSLSPGSLPPPLGSGCWSPTPLGAQGGGLSVAVCELPPWARNGGWSGSGPQIWGDWWQVMDGTGCGQRQTGQPLGARLWGLSYPKLADPPHVVSGCWVQTIPDNHLGERRSGS